MSKADLKAAMDLLDVKNPLRLSSKVPAFKTPPGNLPRGKEPEGKLPHRDLLIVA